MTDDEIAKIGRKCGDARFGYATVNSQDYHRDVSALLAERTAMVLDCATLMVEIESLKAEVRALEGDLEQAKATEPLTKKPLSREVRKGGG